MPLFISLVFLNALIFIMTYDTKSTYPIYVVSLPIFASPFPRIILYGPRCRFWVFLVPRDRQIGLALSPSYLKWATCRHVYPQREAYAGRTG